MVKSHRASHADCVIILLAVAINACVILMLALRGYGYRTYTTIDWVCLALGIAAIMIWRVTGDPLTALITALAAHILAGIPTILKTYRALHTEHAFAWIIAAGAAALGIVSTRWNVANLAFPIYFLIEAVTISGLAIVRRPK